MSQHSQQASVNCFEPSYGDKVYQFLHDAKPGSQFTIDRICERENQPEFIEIIKEYMRYQDWQGGWVFSDDYTRIKKTAIPTVWHTKKPKRITTTPLPLEGVSAGRG